MVNVANDQKEIYGKFFEPHKNEIRRNICNCFNQNHLGKFEDLKLPQIEINKRIYKSNNLRRICLLRVELKY